MIRLCGIARAGCAALAAGIIAACSGGGGGGGGTPPQFVVSPSNLSFSAASPNAARPPSQVITATVNGISTNTLFVRIVVTGPAVTAVDNLVITGPNSGQMMVHVADPATIGPGSHASVITVTACTTDINCSGAQLTGSPATINVAYQVGAVPPPPQAVAPSVGTTGVSGEVIIRGSGFTPVTSVSFGATLATTFTVINATEIHATYPALPTAGTYPIILNNNAIPFTASLQIVDAAAFTTTTIQYPATVQSMRGLAYDAVNRALLVGTNFSTPANNQVLRYTFDGTIWQGPVAASVPNLRDLTLSLDGTKLLTITDTALIEINPVTLVPQPAKIPPPPAGPPVFGRALKAIVAANDGQAVVVASGSSFDPRWLYAIASGTFTSPGPDVYSHPVAGGPGDGSRVVLIQGEISPPQPIRQYSASSGLFSSAIPLTHSSGFAFDENVNPPVFDRSGSRMILDGVVFDTSDFSALGGLPVGGFSSVTHTLSPDGKRAYALMVDSTPLCLLRAFDLSSPPGSGMPFPASGPAVNLPSCPASASQGPVRMLLDPSGTTLFIAGKLSIAVVTPLP